VVDSGLTQRASRRAAALVGEAVAIVMVAALLAFLVLPCVALLLRVGLSDVVAALGKPQVVSALLLSLRASALAALLSLVLGTPVAYLLARCRFPGKAIVESIVQLPLVLPPIVAGVALLMAFGRKGLLGATLQIFGIEVAFTTSAVVIVQTYLSAPFFIQAARGGMEGVPHALEEASRTLGASRLTTFLRVTLPLSWPAFTSGLVLCWGRAMGEFGGTIMFAGNYEGVTRTMPLAILTAMQGGLDTALVLSAMLLVFSVFVFVAARQVISRRGS
jgi:molybdate transport system permease protein